MKRENRTVWVDFLKVIAMIFVILLHIMGNTINTFGLSGNAKVVYEALIAVLNCSVPIFVMVSGMLLLNPEKNITVKTILKKYIAKVLIILVTFGSFFILLEEYFNTKTISFDLIKTVIIRLLNGDVWAHMWYLYMLLGLYLFTPFIKMIINNISSKNLMYLLLFLYLTTIFIPDLNYLFNLKIDLYLGRSPYLFYYLLGYYLGTYNVKEKQKIVIGILTLLSIAGVFINYSENHNFVNISYGTTYIVFIASSLFLLFKNKVVKAPFNKLITVLGECSLGIYVLHQFFINIIYKVLKFDMILTYPYVGLILYTSIVFILSFGVVYLLRKIKPLQKIL